MSRFRLTAKEKLARKLQEDISEKREFVTTCRESTVIRMISAFDKTAKYEKRFYGGYVITQQPIKSKILP